MWYGFCILMFGTLPNVLLGEQASEKYKAEKQRKAKVFGGPGAGAPAMQMARR